MGCSGDGNAEISHRISRAMKKSQLLIY